MNNKKLIHIILLFSFLFIGYCANSKNLTGFIIKESKTIEGKIKITRFNLITSGLIINNINTEVLHNEIWFKGTNDKRFKRYTADQIQGFGFKFKTISYFFRSFNIELNSISKKEKSRRRFLQLYVNISNIYFYKDLLRSDNHLKNSNNKSITLFEQTYLYPEYYLYNQNNGLTKIEISNEYNSIKELLLFYGVQKEFLNAYKKTITNRDIIMILEDYKLWLDKYKISSTI